MAPHIGKHSRTGGGRNGSAGGGGAAAAAAADSGPDYTKLPRGSRETAALLRANGYGVLNEEKLRRPQNNGASTQQQPAGPSRQQHVQPAAAQEQQQQQQRQAPQQARRQVRIVEPEQQQRRQAEKRKPVAKPSWSEGNEERLPRPPRSQQPAQQQQQQQQQQQSQGAGLKRVRSAWKMRPLLVDEKLPVFLEGRDATLLHYDGGEYHQWLVDCEAGRADPADGLPYPLVVQDRELRTLLEIKPVDQQPGGGELRFAAAASAAAGEPAGGASEAAAALAAPTIVVPTVRCLPLAEQPDQLVREHNPPVVQRLLGEGDGQPDVAGSSAAARAATAAWQSAERAVVLDPPYIRYVQPTPDDLDLAVEYDLDEEDEEWLARFNAEAKHAKSRKARRTLGEEWMEHLIDRMEKEYTVELQRQPGKWLVQAPAPSAPDQLPAVSLPSIAEVFPLAKCLQVPGINHYENVIQAVYEYWKGKHERAGRPLIQRMWYEPPWDRRKAARLASSNEADAGEGEAEEGPFAGQDAPAALAGIRKRRLDPDEAKSRFQEIRRDLESARTLADQVRKREKLKKRELQLYKEEWAARMQAVRDGAALVVVRQGEVQDPPAQLSAVWRLEAAGLAGGAGPASSGEAEEGDPLLAGAPQDAAAQAEDRAARLALRRFARDVSGMQPQQRQPQPQQRQQQQQQPARPQGRPRSGSASVVATQRGAQRPAAPVGVHAQQQQQRAGAASPVLKQAGNVRGPPPAPGVRRQAVCMWCRSSEFLMLGCAACPRCFCFKCYQRRPGLGINNWSRAVKDSRYRCVVCRGLEPADAPSANTADPLPAADAADTTSPLRGGRQQAQQEQQTELRLASEIQAEQLGLELPRGLGGAALRSYLLKRQREVFEEEQEEEGGSFDEEAAGGGARELAHHHHQQQQQQPTRAPQQAGHVAGGQRHGRPAAGGGGNPRRQQQQAQHVTGGGDSSSEFGEEEEDEGQQQRRPKQRKLGGAALASHLRRLQHHRHHRTARQHDDQAAASDGEQPSSSDEEAWPHSHIPQPSRKLGGAALRSYIKRQQELVAAGGAGDGHGGEQGEGSEQADTSGHGDAWPHPHIPPPTRKLGGAALRSYIKRQQELLAAGEGEAATDSGEEGGWPYSHIPPPSRKLGGAALRSYIRRQEQLLEGGDGEQHARSPQPQRSGSSSGTAEEFGASSDEAGHRGGGSSSSEGEEEGQSEHKENRAPPAKRARKGLGGAALASHLRKVAAASDRGAGARRAGAAQGHCRRPGRDARH